MEEEKLRRQQKEEKDEIDSALKIDGYSGALNIFDDDIFLLDYWDEDKGLNYLLGIADINPYGEEEEPLDKITTLDSDFYLEHESLHIVHAFRKKLRRLERVWFSGALPQSNPPWFYIEWALSKGFEIPWLQYAIEKNFYVPKQPENQEKDIEKPLNVRAENNYLRLILSLANGVEGFNPKKPYEAAQLILDETEMDLSKETVARYISKAYELESKKRD